LSARKALTAFALAELLFGAGAAGQIVTPGITRAQSTAPRCLPPPSLDRYCRASQANCLYTGAPVASPPNAPVFSLQDSLERAGYTRVRLKVSGYITVDGRVNGKEVKLIVDTGAPTTRLDRERVANAALIWDGHYYDQLQGDRTAQVDAIVLGAFSVGPLMVREFSLGASNRVGKSRGEEPDDGLLGADVLGSCGAIIDYGSEYMFLIHGDGRRGKAPVASLPNSLVFSLQDSLEKLGYTRVKLKRSFTRYITVDGRVNGREAKLIVDTGAPITHLDRERVADSELRWDGHYNDLENLRVVRTAHVDELEIGAFSVGRVRVGEHSLGDVNRVRRSRLDPPVDGLLGAEVLGSCGAIIDYKSECIFLVHRDSPDGKKEFRGHHAD
jgi:predicted aspartyl protease